MSFDWGNLLVNLGYAAAIGLGGIGLGTLGGHLAHTSRNRSGPPAPEREPTIPNALHYPAPPEPEPEPSPLALINRRWKYTSMATASPRSSREPPPPMRLRERPMKLPAATPYYRGQPYIEPTTGSIPNVFAPVATKACAAEPEPPPEKRPGPFADEAWTNEPWQDCTRRVKAPEKLPGYGWATAEQQDWIQELKQQLIDRGEAVCRRGVAEWVHAEYLETFGELDELVWNAVRTGMSMFDFISMMQWERENGSGAGLFGTGSSFDYRSGPGFL